MYGTDKLKNAITWGANLALEIEKILEDGKVSFGEGLTLAWKIDFKGIAEIIKTRKELWKEFIDLDYEEKQELMAFTEENFDLKNDKAEEFIEKTLKFVIDTSNYMDSVRALRSSEKDDSVGGGGPGGGDPGGGG